MERENRPAMAALAMAVLLPALGTSIANITLPTLTQVFGAPFSAVQWVVLAYLGAMTAAIVGVGRLGDAWGRRPLLIAGVSLFTAASLICSIAPSLSTVVAARAFQGVGAATMTVLAMAAVGDIVPKERTGRMMGLLGTMSAIGTALGPAIGGALIATVGWRAVFVILVPLGIAAMYLTVRYVPAGRSAGIAVSMWTLTRDTRLVSGLAMNLLVTVVLMAMLVTGPFYLAFGLGLGATTVGLVMSVGPAVAAIVAIPAGRLVDRIGDRATITGLGGVALGAMLLAVGAGGVAGWLGPVVVLTAGYALFQASNGTAILASVTASSRGTVSGLLNLSRNVGLVLGTSLMGALFSWASADLADVAAGLRATFTIGAALAFVSIVIGVVTMISFPSPSQERA